jgi:hypothetical protein
MTTFQDIQDELVFTEQALPGKWFGLPCLKANSYIFMAQWTNGDAVFKLIGDAHTEALALDGAVLFDPMEKNQPMKQWVQLSDKHSDLWMTFARHALSYARSLPPK